VSPAAIPARISKRSLAASRNPSVTSTDITLPLLKRITVDDRICNGKPVIRGMRITAQTVLEFLMAGTPEDEVLKQYPMLEREDLEACRQFALSLMGNSFSVKDIAA
jgi:uncharacterized protein (DUF433 family)